ncbi:aromatic acid exporter family protein [Streptomyces sp. NPDC049627]|uniref:aromatic acid exporter family protein n=1 Tax=Streptomyces sp. NPDC049627 TaxID=3365595 RepID=UPI00378796FD
MRGTRGIRWAVLVARRRGRAAGETVRRAWEEPGRERDLAVQAVKAALAACVAWAVAGWWLQAPMAFVAPWVAVVLVESTVYRSIAHGLQQVAAIAVGTVVATGVVLMIGSPLGAMCLVLPAVVLLGNWRRLGSQGIYAATGALFVLTAGPVTVAASAARIAEAVFGAVVGIAVNALIRPPVYLRSTRAALEDAACEARQILDAVADRLAADDWDARVAGSLHERALRLCRLVDQARAAVGWSRESLRANLRRGVVSPPGQGYDDAVTVLDYVAVHTTGVTRLVLEACDGDGKKPRPGPHITKPYAEFLYCSARAIRFYTRSRFAPAGQDVEAGRELREVVEELVRSLDDLRQRLHEAMPADPDGLATYGTLLTQARRLTEQLVRH